MPRRGNGLPADAYLPLADLDPPRADAMLRLLRDAGVAAYAVTAQGYVGDCLEGRMPARPLDRLYVDANTRDLADEILRSHMPDQEGEREGAARTKADPRDEESAWREIVASFDFEPTDQVPPWPVVENVDAIETRNQSPEDLGARPRDTADDEDHFVPPPPPPVPRPEPTTALSWLSLFCGPTYLLVATLLGWPVPGWAAFLAVAAFVAGFVTLVVRMGDGPPRDSGPDDGAVL
ncbi:MAG: hypothetical protein ACRDN9_03775 [Streptosporangiaceae bacterium]